MPTPNEAMKEEAQRGLDWRNEFGRGGTEVGIARARDIVNGRDLSEETIGRMVSYFARHEVDKEAEGFRPGEDGYPSNGRIAWALWGGDPGKTWAEREWAKIKNDRDYRPYPNEHAARLKDPDQYDSFRRENDAGGPGIDFIYGIKDGTTEIQAIRFDKNRYSVAEAKKWLESHDFKPILFEEATEREAMEDNRAMVSVSVHIDTEDQADVIEAIANMPQPDVQNDVVNVDENGNEIVMDLTDDRKAGERVTRSDAMEARVESVDDRRVSMSISSEAPVQRSYGDEVLDHKPESIDLSFINSGRAPLLLDHDPEKQIGVIESVSLDASARKLRATVRFSKNALASEVYSDVADNIRGNVSIGYSIAKMVKENNGAIYRATSWRPMEASIVSIPADVTVGVGRSDATVTSEAEPQGLIETPAQVAPKETKMENSVNVAVESRAFDAPVQQDVGLNQTEIKRFSLMRALRALANPTDRALQKEAAFEFECSEAAQRAFGQSAQGILVPADVLRQWNKRDLNTTDDAGLVGQNFRPDAFVDALRNASSVMQAGATMLTGLQGNVKIPKKSATSSGGWFAEGSAASESEATFTSITMSPKTVGAFTDVTRNLMMQGSPDVESLIRNDLAASLAIAIDLGALSGSGSSGQPTGIRATSGINTKDFAATNPTFAEIVGMETEVAADNALRGNLAYIINAAMAGALKTTAKDSGSGLFVLQNGEMNGYRTIVSNQAATGDAYFGNFADLLIGMWGGLDILVDPYTSSTTGTVRIVAMQSVDVAVRHAVSFCLGDADIA